MAGYELELAIRHPRMEDAQQITDMIALCDIEDYGVPDITLGDLLQMWSTVHFETDAWVMTAPGGIIAGYGFVEKRGEDRMDSSVYVHPQYTNLGIGSALLTKVEERAAQYAKTSVCSQRLINQVAYSNSPARQLLEKRGYSFIRLYQRMVIDLKEQTEWSTPLEGGLEIRPFVPDRDEPCLYGLYTETFCDSWGYSEPDYDEWMKGLKGERYDPSLWFIASASERPAAFLVSSVEEDGLFISLLGVKREWRKKGIGQALLRHAFEAGRLRGQLNAMLNVDSDSMTGAQLLYEKAGMRPTFQIALYGKTLG